jgi:hypothetical protein
VERPCPPRRPPADTPVTANDDQLAALGQSVLDQLIAAYDPDDDPELALAVLPGKAVSDPLSLSGEANALRISEWLHGSYDDLLPLHLADCTVMSGSYGSGVPGTQMYAMIARFAWPVGDPASDATLRVAAMLEEARKDLGPDPSALPLGSDPEDWGEVAATCWRTFDTKISASVTTTESTPRPREVNPALWRLRALPVEMLQEQPTIAAQLDVRNLQVARLEEAVAAAAQPPVDEAVTQPAVDEAAVQPAVEGTVAAPAPEEAVAEPTAEATVVQPQVEEAVTQPSVDLSVGAGETVDLSGVELAQAQPQMMGFAGLTAGTSLRTVAMSTQARRLVTADQTTAERPMIRHLGRVRDHRVKRIRPELYFEVPPAKAHIDLDAVVTAPTVDTSTTKSTDLHVHLEHCLVTITRRLSGRPWWHHELVRDEGWYVPGMHRGDLVPEPASPDVAHCLPRALLLVRNVEISGTWTADARVALTSAAPAIGPFLMSPASSTMAAGATQETTVLGIGTQVIGVLGTPMPVLPPQSDPHVVDGPDGGG